MYPSLQFLSHYEYACRSEKLKQLSLRTNSIMSFMDFFSKYLLYDLQGKICLKEVPEFIKTLNKRNGQK